MKPTSSLAALLWLHVLGHSAAFFHDRQLRGPTTASLPHTALSSTIDEDRNRDAAKPKKVAEKTSEENSEQKAAKPKKLAKKNSEENSEQKTVKDIDREDTLAHELVDQATIHPSKKAFDALDGNHDGKISYQEYMWTSTASRRVARYRFNCSDHNMDSFLDLKEFTDMQSKPQDLERCLSMLLAFQMVDKNRDGEVSQSELWTTVDQSQFDSRWAFMIACSDLNSDGKISPMEFSTDMYGCIEKKSEEAANNFSKFALTDMDKNGCANETEMITAVRMLFGLSLIPHKLVSDTSPSVATEALARRWIHCVDSDLDQCLSKKEYVDGLLNPTPREDFCIGTSYADYETDMDFQIMDTSNDNQISEQEYYAWCEKLDVEIDVQEANALFVSADANKDGFIDADEFRNAGKAHEGDGPGVLFFHRAAQSSLARSLTAWRGSIQKTWAGLYDTSA